MSLTDFVHCHAWLVTWKAPVSTQEISNLTAGLQRAEEATKRAELSAMAHATRAVAIVNANMALVPYCMHNFL